MRYIARGSDNFVDSKETGSRIFRFDIMEKNAMIEKITFENFRGFDRLELSAIKPITLISGKNNIGKSSVLEGIFLFLDHVDADSFWKISRFRGIQPAIDAANLWEPAFYQMDAEKTMQIQLMMNGVVSTLAYVKDTSFMPVNDVNVPQDIMNHIIFSAKTAYTLKFKYRKENYIEDGHFVVSPAGVLRNITTNLEYNQIDTMPFPQFINTVIMDSDKTVAEWFGKLELSGKKQQIIEIMQILDPKICDLSTIVVNGQGMLYVKIDKKLFPLKLAGDGLNKLLFIVLSIISNPDSILLIDEIESGFHNTMYPKLWETIALAARENACQIIATTHSYECIAGAIDGIEKADRKSDFC